MKDTKRFKKTVKPPLSDKIKSSEKITLVNEEKMSTNADETAKILNSLFSNVVKDLKILKFKDIDFSAECISHRALKPITKFRNRPKCTCYYPVDTECKFNVHKTFRRRPGRLSLSFSKVSVDDVLKEINKLGDRKVIQSTDIPVKILKQNADIIGSYIFHFLDVYIDKGTFPSALKHANITSVFKENYRPVSILTGISKIFEKLLCNQITPFVDQFLCGFRKGLNTQHCLLAM